MFVCIAKLFISQNLECQYTQIVHLIQKIILTLLETNLPLLIIQKIRKI
jgi:hypothetical protein